jgi:hypothetical protein
MLKASTRVIVAFALATSAKAALPDAIVGWWRNDNQERFTEMQLRQDGSFASLSRNEAIIAVVPLRERSGRWRLQGAGLTLDAADPHTHARAQERFKVIDATGRALRVRTTDGHIDTYRRLSYPTCADTALRRERGASVDGVVGGWRGHYRTHDLEISFSRGGRAVMRASDPGHAYRISGICTWQLSDKTVTLLPVKEEDRQGEIIWTLTAVGADCLSFTDHSGMIYTLQRAR